LDRTFEPKKLG